MIGGLSTDLLESCTLSGNNPTEAGLQKFGKCFPPPVPGDILLFPGWLEGSCSFLTNWDEILHCDWKQSDCSPKSLKLPPLPPPPWATSRATSRVGGGGGGGLNPGFLGHYVAIY